MTSLPRSSARPRNDAPQYRFRGQQAPEKREALRAEITTKPAGGGTEATLRLYDVIDSWGGPWGVSASEVAEALDALADGVQQINLHINSPGGEALEGVAILNVLRAHPARVLATVDGLAGSAASFIAAGADETVMARNSQMMIHDAWGLCVGNAADMTEVADALDKLSDNIASIYAEKAGGGDEKWRTAMRAETWFLADEAVAAGLADSVIQKDADAPQDRFDLTVFAYAGRTEAPQPLASADEPEDAAAPAAAIPPVTAAHVALLAEAEALLALS